MVSDPAYARNSVEGFKRRVAEDGPLASFAAVPAMTAKQVPYTMGKQVSFDYACELVHAVLVAVCSAELLETVDGFTPVIAALPAAVLACVLSHPGDAVLTQFFKRGPQPGGVAGSVGLLMKEGGGPLALFTGLKARLLHVIGIIWVQLIIYDKVKVALGLPATGH
jgi:solute carrier family 25 phosphate transporter 3